MIWASMEFVQGILFTGFAWGSLAYSQGPNLWLLQWAAVGGGFLVSAAIVFNNGLLAHAIMDRKGRFQRAIFALCMMILLHGLGYLFMDEPDYETKPMTAGIVQSNFPLEMKWDRDYTEEMVFVTVRQSRALAQTSPYDLLVWPEALVMANITSPAIHSELLQLTQETGADLFTGAVRNDTGGNFNSSYLIRPTGTMADYYDKVHLAPFGEYVPLSKYLPFLHQLVPSIGDIQSGTELKVFETNERKLGPLICFEVLFPSMADQLRRDGADVLVVITNLAWFGSSNAIPQELAIAKLRAIETRLPLIQCANTGISGVFDPWGRFTMVNRYINREGVTHVLKEDSTPYDTVMRRLTGSLPVAAPEARPVINGPRTFPYITCGISIALLCFSMVMPVRVAPAPPPTDT